MFSAIQIRKMLLTFDEPEYKKPSTEFIRLIASGFLEDINQRQAAETLAKLLVSKYVF